MTSSAAHAAHVGTENAFSKQTTLTIGVDIGGTKVAAGVVDEAARSPP